MKPDFSVIQLMLEATWVVQAVVLLLILASVLSWAAIFRKGLLLRRVQRLSDEFERDFWSGGQLNELYQAALHATQQQAFAKNRGPAQDRGQDERQHHRLHLSLIHI